VVVLFFLETKKLSLLCPPPPPHCYLVQTLVTKLVIGVIFHTE